MLTLHYAPRTRAIRVRWLLEELGLPYELRRVEFVPPTPAFSQPTPTGKLPVLEDDDVVIGESGAIVEYVVERHGKGRLAPPIGSPLRGAYLHWVHFSEATAFPPLGVIVRHTLFLRDAAELPTVIADARERALGVLDVVERAVGDGPYLLGADFSAADVMMGFTLGAARMLGLLGDGHPGLAAYMARLEARPAFRAATAD